MKYKGATSFVYKLLHGMLAGRPWRLQHVIVVHSLKQPEGIAPSVPCMTCYRTKVQWCSHCFETAPSLALCFGSVVHSKMQWKEKKRELDHWIKGERTQWGISMFLKYWHPFHASSTKGLIFVYQKNLDVSLPFIHTKCACLTLVTQIYHLKHLAEHVGPQKSINYTPTN